MVSSGADANKDVYPILVDSSGRPYVILDDGAGNTLPAGDAVERPIYVILTDGVEVAQVGDDDKLQVHVFGLRPDGANVMPSGHETAHPIFFKLTDGTTDALIDPESQGLSVSRAIHQRVVKSNMWMCSYRKIDLADSTSFHLNILVGAAKNMHMIYNVFVEGKSQIYLTENPTLANNGTELTEYNMNRQTGTDATGKVYRDPGVTVAGTIIETNEIGQVGHFTAAGGTMDSGSYWLLKKSENYLIWVYNNSGATSDVVIQVMWHED